MIARTIIVASDSCRGEDVDHHIQFAREQKSDPLVVLGETADELLRSSRRLHDCDFVFNPYPDFLASLCTGLSAVGRPAYFMSAGVRPVSVWNWQHFGNECEAHSAKPFH